MDVHDRYLAWNHVELEAITDGPTANAGTRIRGHEFHYSRTSIRDDGDARFAFETVRGDGIDGDYDGLLETTNL